MNNILRAIQIVLGIIILYLLMNLFVNHDTLDKPILYIYPKEDINVSIRFDKPELILTSYPKYKDGWSVTAKENGTIIDKNKKEYYALYWDEMSISKHDFNTGFYVTKDNAINFLEEKLSNIGLNKRESNEFIMYWLPILEKNKKNLVNFEFTKEIEKDNKLYINPKPDSLLRVHIFVKKVYHKQSIKEQKINKFNRHGYTIVEWGGSVIK